MTNDKKQVDLQAEFNKFMLLIDGWSRDALIEYKTMLVDELDDITDQCDLVDFWNGDHILRWKLDALTERIGMV